MLQSSSIAEQSHEAHEEDAKDKAKEILLNDYNGSDGFKAAQRDTRRADLNKHNETNEHTDEVRQKIANDPELSQVIERYGRIQPEARSRFALLTNGMQVD